MHVPGLSGLSLIPALALLLLLPASQPVQALTCRAFRNGNKQLVPARLPASSSITTTTTTSTTEVASAVALAADFATVDDGSDDDHDDDEGETDTGVYAPDQITTSTTVRYAPVRTITTSTVRPKTTSSSSTKRTTTSVRHLHHSRFPDTRAQSKPKASRTTARLTTTKTSTKATSTKTTTKATTTSKAKTTTTSSAKAKTTSATPLPASFTAAAGLPSAAIYNVAKAAAAVSNANVAGSFPPQPDAKKKDLIKSDWAKFSDSPALFFMSDMDVDCDGIDYKCPGNGDGQSQTNFGAMSAYNVPWAVIPQTFVDKHPEIEPNTLVAVVCNGQMFYGIFADANGDTPEVIGEASWLLAKTCFGDQMSGDFGHAASDVLYIVFTGKAAVVPGVGEHYIADFGALRTLGDNLVGKLASNLQLY